MTKESEHPTHRRVRRRKKRSPITIVAMALLALLLLASLAGNYLLYQRNRSLSSELAAEKKRAAAEAKSLRGSIKSLNDELRAKGVTQAGTPEEVVRAALVSTGRDVGYEPGKYVVSLRSADQTDATVWSGPFGENFDTEFRLARVQGRWQIVSRGTVKP